MEPLHFIAGLVAVAAVISFPIWKGVRENELIIYLVGLAKEDESVTVSWVVEKIHHHQAVKESELQHAATGSGPLRRSALSVYLWLSRVKGNPATIEDTLEWLELENALLWSEPNQCYFRSTPPYN